MSLTGVLKELHRRKVWQVAVAYSAVAVGLLEVLTHLFHNFEAPHWVLKVMTTLLIAGLPVACLMAWGFEFKEGRVRAMPSERPQAPPALPVAAVSAPASIAVLPFEDMSPEQDQKYLGHGIAEELLNSLAGIDQLKVAARTSSFALASRGASMQEIGDTLHVRHVLEGSVRRSGQKLRITAQLIDVQSGFHLFSEAYDRAAEDIFDIQNEIAREIAAALLPKLGLSDDMQLVKQGTRNIEAYNLRLQAHQQFLAVNPGSLRLAIEGLQQAVKLDPRYWDALGDLAHGYAWASIWAGDPVPYLVKASSATAVALANAPTHVMALLVQAFLELLINRDRVAAARGYELARATGIDQSFWAFNKAYCYDGPLGRYAEAIAALRDAERKDPLAPNLKWALLEMQLACDKVTEAADTARALQSLGFVAPGVSRNIGFALVAAGDISGARVALAAAHAAAGAEFHDSALLQFAIDEATGDRRHAQELLDQLLQSTSANGPESCYLIGDAFKALGEYDRTFEWWNRAVERHEPYMLVSMPMRNRNHPVIGKDPRLRQLLKRMGLESDADEKVAGV